MRSGLANGGITATAPAQAQAPPPQADRRARNGTGSLNRKDLGPGRLQGTRPGEC